MADLAFYPTVPELYDRPARPGEVVGSIEPDSCGGARTSMAMPSSRCFARLATLWLAVTVGLGFLVLARRRSGAPRTDDV